MVRALLSYRLGTGDRGRIVVVVICVKDGKLVCVDAGTIAFLTRHEGGVEVTFPVRAPAGAGIGIALELLEDGVEGPLTRVSLNYRAAP